MMEKLLSFFGVKSLDDMAASLGHKLPDVASNDDKLQHMLDNVPGLKDSLAPVLDSYEAKPAIDHTDMVRGDRGDKASGESCPAGGCEVSIDININGTPYKISTDLAPFIGQLDAIATGLMSKFVK
jgi:hypothetical protein